MTEREQGFHPEAPDELADHLIEIGIICAHWAYLEYLLEIGVWASLGLLNRQIEGRMLTGNLSIEMLAKRLRDLAHLRFNDPDEQKIFAEVTARIDGIKDERNLAVHGVRAAQPDKSFTAMVARGKYKSAPQLMTLIRLRSLTVEIRVILDDLESVLHKHNIITTRGAYK